MGARMPDKREVKNEDIRQEIYDIFDEYVHGDISRRGFLSRVSKYTAAGVSAAAILAYLAPSYAEARKTEMQDPRLKTEFVSYASPKGAGEMRAILARKIKAKKKMPGILVVHENRGLNPHIEDVTRRAALEGYIAIGPDALTPLGGYPGTDDKGRELHRTRDRQKVLQDFIAAFKFLQNHSECNGKVGVVGFCFGGWVSNMMAARVSDLAAAVPFYGGPAPLEEVSGIKAPLLLQFAENDKRVNAAWPDYETALKKHKKTYTAYTYPETQHGFHNDTTPRYHEKSAQLAWQRTIAFFNQHLG